GGVELRRRTAALEAERYPAVDPGRAGVPLLVELMLGVITIRQFPRAIGRLPPVARAVAELPALFLGFVLVREISVELKLERELDGVPGEVGDIHVFVHPVAHKA